MLPSIFHQSRFLTPTIPTPMGICIFYHYINKYGYYIIRKYSSFYIVKIRPPKHNKTYINFNITLTLKVKLTLHPLAYLDMPNSSHMTTFNTHTPITQSFSKHIHTYNHNYTTHYTHLLILLSIPSVKINHHTIKPYILHHKYQTSKSNQHIHLKLYNKTQFHPHNTHIITIAPHIHITTYIGNTILLTTHQTNNNKSQTSNSHKNLKHQPKLRLKLQLSHHTQHELTPKHKFASAHRLYLTSYNS